MKTTDAFERAFNKLNTEQKKAATLLEGPVLVLAGPGTGKTQILASRIGYILKHTDAQPSNILCLTFTDAGVAAMNKRLVSFIGPEAYNITVNTYHAFCNSVIQENKEVFEFFGDYQPIDDLERLQVFREIIDDLDVDNPLKRLKSIIYMYLPHLQSLFQEMKKEGLKAEDIERMVAQELERFKSDPDNFYKRNGKGYKKGDLKTNNFNKLKEKLDKTLAGARLFEDYQKRLQKRLRYDYQDMILFVLDAFQKNENLLLDYQEKYQYILVDEYQDTNGSQNQLIHLLSSYWDRPNTFVVGDDDQAIYRFQGANLSNIVEFHERYTPEVVVLEKNYRSTQPVLDLSTHFINHNESRLINEMPDLDKRLIAGIDHPKAVKPEILPFESVMAEESFIISELRRIRDTEEVPLHEVAVLFRSKSDASRIVDILEKENFPLIISKRANILEERLVQNLRALLSFIAQREMTNYTSDKELSTIFYFPYFKFSISEVNRLLHKYAKAKRDKPDVPLYQWLDDGLESHPEDFSSSFVTFYNTLNDALRWVHEDTVQVLFEKVITKFGILDYVFASPKQTWLLQLLNTLFDFIKEKTAKNPSLSLQDILTYLDQLDEEGLGLPVVKTSGTKDGVNFITCHSAKGLEYKRVYVIRLNRDRWEKKRAPNNKSFKMPSAASNVEHEKLLQLEDERRLFFVAATRAKERLYFTYSEHNDQGKNLEPSRFIHEVTDYAESSAKSGSLDQENAQMFLYHTLKYPDAKYKGVIDHDLVEEKLENLEISVTALNKYLRCSLTFYFENIVRIPSARSAYLGYGNAIHGTLEDAIKHFSAAGDLDQSLVHALYNKYLTRYASHFTAKQFDEFLLHGKGVLDDYVAEYQGIWATPEQMHFEYPISQVVHGGVPITGKLDRVDIYDNRAKVIDYKTGRFKSEKLKNNVEKPPGGDYWRQIVFYKFLIDGDNRNNWEFQSGALDFVEKKNGKYAYKEVNVTPDDEAAVTQQLQETYQKIKNHDFFPGCQEDDCFWCNMMKDSTEFRLSPIPREMEEDA